MTIFLVFYEKLLVIYLSIYLGLLHHVSGDCQQLCRLSGDAHREVGVEHGEHRGRLRRQRRSNGGIIDPAEVHLTRDIYYGHP